MLTRRDTAPAFHRPEVTVGKFQGEPRIALAVGPRYILIEPDDLDSIIDDMRDVHDWIGQEYEQEQP